MIHSFYYTISSPERNKLRIGDEKTIDLAVENLERQGMHLNNGHHPRFDKVWLTYRDPERMVGRLVARGDVLNATREGATVHVTYRIERLY